MSKRWFNMGKQAEHAGKNRRVYSQEILQCHVRKIYDVGGRYLPGRQMRSANLERDDCDVFDI